MEDQALTLIVGTVLGFISALLVEFIRIRLEARRKVHERVLEAKNKEDAELREFLLKTFDQDLSMAWLTLVKTQKRTLRLIQKRSTDAAIITPRRGSESNETALAPEANLQKYLLKQIQMIGRQADCDIHLDDSAVSRLHAMIRQENNTFFLYDLGSRSGTMVNDQKVNKEGVALHFNDSIQVGGSVFIFDGIQTKRQLLSSPTIDVQSLSNPSEDADVTQPS